MYFLLKMLVFHCYVSLPEGTKYYGTSKNPNCHAVIGPSRLFLRKKHTGEAFEPIRDWLREISRQVYNNKGFPWLLFGYFGGYGKFLEAGFSPCFFLWIFFWSLWHSRSCDDKKDRHGRAWWFQRFPWSRPGAKWTTPRGLQSPKTYILHHIQEDMFDLTIITPWKFNVAPENLPSQKESSLPTIIFQGLC